MRALSKWTVLLLIALGACKSPARVLEGAWQSDEAKSQAEVYKVAAKLDPKIKDALLAKGVFGRAIKVFGKTGSLAIVGDQCTAVSPYTVDVADEGVVELHIKEPSGQEVTVALEVQGDELRQPIERTLVNEVYTRISVEELAKKTPCLQAVMSKLD